MTCAHCSKPFERRSKTGAIPMYCSARCRRDAYELRNAPPCLDCGRPVSTVVVTRCGPCGAAYQAKVRREARDARRVQILEMWNAGHSLREIAREFHSSKGSIGGTLTEMRNEGIDVPYRYRMENGRRLTAARDTV